MGNFFDMWIGNIVEDLSGEVVTLQEVPQGSGEVREQTFISVIRTELHW